MKQLTKLKDKNLLFLIVLITMFVAISVFLSQHIIASFLQFKTFMFESGEFYSDRLLNFSLAKSAQEYGINFLDPLSRQETIFYQFFPFWILGFLANLLKASPLSVVNLIQIFLAPAFFITIYLLAKEIVDSKWIALLSVLIMFFFGSLEFFLTKTTSYTTYGEHAVIMPFVRQIYGFYLDNYALLFGYLALVFFIKIIKSPSFNWKNSLAFIFFTFFSFNTHLLPAIFFIILFAFLLFTRTHLETNKYRKQNFVFLMSTSFIYTLFLFIYKLRPPMLIIIIFGLAIFAYFLAIAKDRHRYLIFIAGIVPLALIMGLNIYTIRSTGHLAGSYNDIVRTRTLYIPVITYIVAYSPLIILALIALFKSKKNNNISSYYPVFLLAMIIVVYNNFFGYNNHPYRFVAYVFPLLAIFAAQGISVLYKNRRSVLSINNVLLIGSFILIIIGSWVNIAEYQKYAYTTSRAVESKVFETAMAIEKIRNNNKELVFYVDPEVSAIDRLAPYTGAKFYYSSPLSYNTRFTSQKIKILDSQLRSGDFITIYNHVIQHKLGINYIVTSRLLKFPRNKNEYLVFKSNSLYIYKLV